VQVVQELLDKV